MRSATVPLLDSPPSVVYVESLDKGSTAIQSLLLGLILLHFLSKKRKYDGQVFLAYLAWYGLGRVWIEGLRTDSLYLGSFRVSQLLAGASFAVATGLMLYIRFRKHPDGSAMLVNRRPESVEEAEASEAED